MSDFEKVRCILNGGSFNILGTNNLCKLFPLSAVGVGVSVSVGVWCFGGTGCAGTPRTEKLGNLTKKAMPTSD